jgi:hypothetical protein
MGVIFQKRPGVDWRFGLLGEAAHARDEIVSIGFVLEDWAFFDPPDDNVVQGAGGIQPWLRGMVGLLGRLGYF